MCGVSPGDGGLDALLVPPWPSCTSDCWLLRRSHGMPRPRRLHQRHRGRGQRGVARSG